MRWIEVEVEVPAQVGHPMDIHEGHVVVQVCGPNDNPDSDRVRWADEPVVVIVASPDDDEMCAEFHDVEQIKMPLSALRDALAQVETP